MNKTKSTKRAFLSAVLALVVCVSMLIGTTFAWFTDSVTSGRNTIQSGNLDVELYYALTAEDVAADKWTEVTDESDIYGYDLWEPGFTKVAYFKVVNNGSLALKYQLTADVYAETAGVNVYGDRFLLSDHLYTAIVDADVTREQILSSTAGTNLKNSIAMKSAELLESGDSTVVGLAIWMPTTVGNEANHNGTDIPSIEFGINLIATQAMAETDSFGKDYDEAASLLPAWDGTVGEVPAEVNGVITITSAEELAGLAKSVNEGNTYAGKKIVLAKAIDLNNQAWTPIGAASEVPFATAFNGTFDGQNFAIYNLNVSGTENVGLFGYVGNAASIHNVRVVNATVSGNHYVGTVLGYGYLSQNSLAGCTVENATVVCSPDANNDNGDKAGIIAGMAINGNIYDNKVINSKIYAFRDFGSIVGNATAENNNIKVFGNTAENVELYYVDCADYVDGTNRNMNEIVGRTTGGKTVSIEANSATNVALNDDALKVASSEQPVTKIEKDETVYYAPGTYEFPVLNEGSEIIGLDGVVFEDTLSGTLNNTTIKNIHIKDGNAQRWAYSKGTLVFEDCTFEATSVYAIHYDGLGGANITYKNCTIIGWVAIGGGAEHITFDGCKIYGNGTYGVIRLYSEGTIKNCTFDVSAVNTTDVYQDGIHAVDCTITVENVTNVNGAVEDLFNISGTGAIKYGEVSNVNSEAALGDALTDGGSATLAGDVEISENVQMNGGTLNGNGNTLDAYDTPTNDNCAVTTTGGTVENITITGDSEATRALGSVITFTNCTNDGEKVTVDNFKTLFMYPGDDVDFGKLSACTIIIDGETLEW